MATPERTALLADTDADVDAQRLAPGVRRQNEPVESTPLLSTSSTDDTPRYDGGHERVDGYDAAPVRAGGKTGVRWPSLVAMAVLVLASIAVIILAFLVPSTVEEYAKAAALVEPTNLSLESITAQGVRARVQANFRLDAQRVTDQNVRRVGRFATWMVGQLATDETTISVYLPEKQGVLLGTVTVPPVMVSIVDGQNTAIDLVADVVPGDAEGIRIMANEWLKGRLQQVQVLAKADVSIKSGIIPLGTHSVSEYLTLEANKLPTLPLYNITKLTFEETPLPGSSRKAMMADVSVTTHNDFPLSVDVPELEFEILVQGCRSDDPFIVVADAVTSPVAIRPHAEVVADVRGIIIDLPEALVHACPQSESSPLDLLVRRYMDGKGATVFVRGKRQRGSDTPDWLAEILSSLTVAVPFPGRSFDGLIRNFSMADVHLTMPDPMAEPGDPAANPKVSGTIQVLAAIPSEMNFDLKVTGVRARADVLYKSKKLGELLLRRWQPANSTRLEATKDHEAELKIRSRIADAPLNVTDSEVLSDAIQALLFGGRKVVLDVNALVDVKVETVLGQLILKDVPASGKIPVKAFPVKSIGEGLKPVVGDIRVARTAPSSLVLEARVNFTNPTDYTACVPFVSALILCNDSLLGEVRAQNLDVTAGANKNVLVSLIWDPSRSGEAGVKTGRDLLSRYLSGLNTSITLKAHRDSIPSLPQLGEALSRFNLTSPLPRLGGGSPNGPDDGGDGDDEAPRFLRDAVFHVISSAATFTLVSPLRYDTLFVERIDATAYYNHTEPVGRIAYDRPFAAPPGASETPRLPVQWSLGSVGYGKLREALGGQLRLDADAEVAVRLGRWTETVWYQGRGIGAKVRL